MSHAFDPRLTGWILLTALIAATGGGLFAALGWPAAWLMGAMVATAAAAIAGLPVGLPPQLRVGAFLLLGISMGSSVTPESLAAMRTWPGSIALLVVSIAATILVSTWYLERIHGWDRTTARFAAMPGAFASIAVIAATSSADLPRVILAQGLRVFTLVALMPLILALGNGGTAGAAAGPAPQVNSLAEALVVIAASGALAFALIRLRVPAGALLGAMIASAALHATSLVHGRFPPALIILGFVATGAVIGARFRGTTLATMVRTVPGAVVFCSPSPSPPPLPPSARGSSACRSASSGSPTRPVASRPWRRWRSSSTSNQLSSAPTISCASLAST